MAKTIKDNGLLFWPCVGPSHFREQLGIVTYLSLATQDHQLKPLSHLHRYAIPSLKHRQIGFFFDEYNNPLAYIVWADLAEDVERAMLNDPDFMLHESEWNEGGRRWVMEFVAPFGRVREILRFAKRHLFLDHEYVVSFRRKTENPRISVWAHWSA
jgi:cytolysin-activating lysine-acyltransferase